MIGVIIEPITDEWAWLDQVTGGLDADFVAAATEYVEPHVRPALDDQA